MAVGFRVTVRPQGRLGPGRQVPGEDSQTFRPEGSGCGRSDGPDNGITVNFGLGIDTAAEERFVNLTGFDILTLDIPRIVVERAYAIDDFAAGDVRIEEIIGSVVTDT